MEEQIRNKLVEIDAYGSVKIYLCFYNVTLEEMIAVIHRNMKCSYVIRHNVINVHEVPAGLLLGEDQDPITQYVEVSKVYKMDSFTHTSRVD